MTVDSSFLAAVDLGSNSFHMVVGRVVDGRLALVRRMKQMVRLRAGLDDRGELGAAVQRGALECLSRFGRVTRRLPRANVRAVGTSTLRAARNSETFLSRARSALGHPVEILSGVEEARLTYAGVTSDLPQGRERRLVIDIGGGSTELILGEGSHPVLLESFAVGSSSLTLRYFEQGRIDAPRFQQAEAGAASELGPALARLRRLGWDVAIGSSGSVRAAARAAYEDVEHRALRRQDVQRLREACIDAGSTGALSLPGISRARAESFPGGLALLSAVLDGLGLENVNVSPGALREGVLAELLARLTPGARRPAALPVR